MENAFVLLFPHRLAAFLCDMSDCVQALPVYNNSLSQSNFTTMAKRIK